MAAIFNYGNEGNNSYCGNTLTVTIEIFTENVIIVTGCVGSRKYKGALLGSHYEATKPLVPDNVFNWDYSIKHNFPYTNLSVKKFFTTETNILPSKLLSGPGYICDYCKRKFSNNHKTERKTPVSESIKQPYKSDIILLKQTLSYPELSVDNMNNTKTSIEDQHTKVEPSNSTIKKLKRKRPFQSDSLGVDKIIQVAPLKEATPKPKPAKIEKHEDKPIKESNSLKIPKLNNENKLKHTFVKSESVIYHENHRIMPKTLERLNKISSIESNQEIEEFINRECPKKPKKMWMKMNENEDNQKSCESLKEIDQNNSNITDIAQECFTEMSPLENAVDDFITETLPDNLPLESIIDDYPLESVIKNSLESISKYFTLESISKDFPLEFICQSNPSITQDCFLKTSEKDDTSIESTSDLIDCKSETQSKFSRFNRSYKIKQTLHDKVILTVERGSLTDCPEKVPPVHDIYSFTDDDDSVPTAEPDTLNSPSANCVIADVSLLTCVDENNRTPSIKSNNSSKRSKKVKISKKSNNNNINNDKIDKGVFEEQQIKIESKVGKIDDVALLDCCENSSGTMFKLEDVVWAKITGYPYWPARIISFSQEDDMFVACIEWYAWKEVSFIKVNSLFHFKEFYQSKYQKKKRNSKYQEAVKLARGCCGMMDGGLESLVSDDGATLCSTRGSGSECGSNEGSDISVS